MNLLRFFGFVLFFIAVIEVYGENAQREMAYKVRLAFLDAGDLNFKLSFSSIKYSFLGDFETRGLINNYYRWKGKFAATGRLENGLPKMERYYARSESKDHSQKFVVIRDESVRVLPPGGKTFQFESRPKGNDLLTVLFLTPICYEGKYVNDGEDTYQISLIKKKEKNHKDMEFNAIFSCHYRVKDYKGRSRRLVVTLADSIYGVITKEVRVRIPLLPDIVFDLRKVS